jgi:hypothetical protein
MNLVLGNNLNVRGRACVGSELGPVVSAIFFLSLQAVVAEKFILFSNQGGSCHFF